MSSDAVMFYTQVKIQIDPRHVNVAQDQIASALHPALN